MSKLNFLVYLNTYSDAAPSNNPSLSNFKWSREITGIPATNPISEAFTLAPGESKTIFSGVRTLGVDNTTQFSLQLKPLSSSTYRVQATSGAAPLFRTARSTGANATTAVTAIVNGPIVTYSSPASASAQPAQFVGIASGVATSVTIVALTPGTAGNVSLTGDGTSSLNQLIVAWNSANPSNQLQLQLGDDTQILDLDEEITLTGGTDAVVGLNMAAVVVGDQVRIGSQFNVLNQGKFKVLAKTANSFTVENFTAVNEGPITLGSTFADQIRIYSAAGVQEGDTLVLKSGFSSVTYGSYQITDVTDNYVEFYSTSVLPQETGIVSADLAVYSQAKNLVYLESDKKATVTINGVQMASMEPFVINNSTKPGIFMLKATVWSFEVTNNSLDTASCFVATVE